MNKEDRKESLEFMFDNIIDDVCALTNLPLTDYSKQEVHKRTIKRLIKLKVVMEKTNEFIRQKGYGSIMEDFLND